MLPRRLRTPLRGRGGYTVRPWLSCRVHGPASLWNINMTRNIISHDSRRRGNTKYYPAEAPAGRSTPVASLLRLYFALGSSPQDMQRSRNAMINWLSRVTTWPQKACARSRPRERLTSSRSRRSFRGNDRTHPNFCSPRNGTALFASVICAGCDLSLVFSELSFGKGY